MHVLYRVACASRTPIVVRCSCSCRKIVIIPLLTRKLGRISLDLSANVLSRIRAVDIPTCIRVFAEVKHNMECEKNVNAALAAEEVSDDPNHTHSDRQDMLRLGKRQEFKRICACTGSHQCLQMHESNIIRGPLVDRGIRLYVSPDVGVCTHLNLRCID